MKRADSGTDATPFRPLRPDMRWWLWFDSFLVLSAGVQLFVLTEQTANYFAWTINPPMTAAFLGACYWGGLVLVFLSARERLWANARTSVPGIWLFTLLTLLATLMHIDKFHMNSFFGWAWLVIYVAVPLLLPVLFVRQQFLDKRPDSPRLHPLPSWLRAAIAIQAAVMIALGCILFVAPQTSGSLWPWALTPLTGRAVASWLIGMGCVAVNALWEGDLRRVRVTMYAYIALGGLHLVALGRYAGSLDWADARLWLYAVVLVAIVLTGVFGWLASGRAAVQGQPRPRGDRPELPVL